MSTTASRDPVYAQPDWRDLRWAHPQLARLLTEILFKPLAHLPSFCADEFTGLGGRMPERWLRLGENFVNFQTGVTSAWEADPAAFTGWARRS